MVVASVGQLLLLVLLACSTHYVVVCSSLYTNETDRLSLLGFKDAISLDPHQVLMSWNDSTHFCDWEGVMCRVKTPPLRVTSLNLSGRGLVGHISPSIGNLTFLQYLVLEDNTLKGEIPSSIGHMSRLKTLRLHINSLEGRIPSFANCSKLRTLDVSYNNLVGLFPAAWPPELQVLQISTNNLTGTIPASLANITTLQAITCAENHFQGNIPSEFADLSSLLYLYAGENQLAGRFPQAILNISTLLGLNLAVGDLSGEVPPNLFSSLSNLHLLQLDGNFFIGHIPTSFTNASRLIEIDLSDNKFTGLVPSKISKLKNLAFLNLEENRLQAHSKEDWKFLESLGNCTDLQVFSMSQNRLSGDIPSSLGNISNQLEKLYLTENQLSGNFPSGLENLCNLFILALGGNRFIGVLPEWIGTLKNLQQINLRTNFLTGVIPSSLSNLTHLGSLYLDSNQFTSHIQLIFGNFTMLQELDISRNNLHGGVPMEIFRIPTIMLIGLSCNNFNGILPSNIGKAKHLVKLLISSNKLSGDIPNTIGGCESLQYIDLASNIFSGSIPTSLGSITSLKVLNLSTNKLTGPIPTSLGNLQLIEKLDLSFNHLHGEVPRKGIFGNATVVWIDGNQGLCGGIPKLHMPACVVMPSNSTRHNESLILKIIIPIASMVLAMVTLGLFLWRGKHKSKPISQTSVATEFPLVSYHDIARATQGFSVSSLIGSGKYSYVYQGKLFEDAKEVAIKVFKLDTRGAQKIFIAECNALRNMRHRNLVPILTVCSSIDCNGNDFKALVYEFMPQGDLNELLYSTRDYEYPLHLYLITMAQRIKIVVDVADALEYLHHNNHGTIVHCDLKPSNILLDDNMTAHVGDFGLATFKVDSPMLCLDNPNSSLVGIIGTIGYAAPEYARGGQVSTAVDVYSFGVILLEILLRKRPTDEIFKDGLNIVKFVEISFPDRVMEIVDRQLIEELELCQETSMALKEKGVRSLLSMINIGICCTKLSPGERIDMHNVAAKLHGIMDSYLVGN